jgi:TRAP-type C4-dicarboxylate transport system permease small subunit
VYRGADKSLARPGRKQATATEDFDVSYILLIIIIGGILVLFIYITRLATNEIFSSPNKIHREVGGAKDLSAPRYRMQ